MAGRTGEFNKQIRNARNSNDEFDVEVHTDPNATHRPKRVSASYLKSSIIHGAGTKKNFATITPQGLPPDLIGNEDNLVERQNVLIEPKGYRHEAARLPPFKPFKTISDEDNIHLLPGETGERARLNLLDTKAVTKKDVQDTRLAYEKQRKQYPELYRKQQAVVDEADAPQQQKKKGFFGKLFGKKQKEQQLPLPPPPPPPPQIKEPPPPPPPPLKKEPPPPPPPEKVKPPAREPPVPRKSIIKKPIRKSIRKSIKPPPPPPKKAEPSARRRPTLISKRKSLRPPTPSESEDESTSESSSEEEQQWGYGQPPGQGGMMPYYGGGGYPQPSPYPGQGGYPQSSPYPGLGGYPQYAGMPGGYSPYFNQGYASGFGPTQMPLPPYNQGMEAIQLERCKQMLKDKQRKIKGEGDESGTISSWQTSKVKPKKAQGLNFDFLPHDDLATEVTMVIEPDDPEPLQFAVENGIMPIICCYMPSSVAVQQAPDYQASSVQAYSNMNSTSTSSPSTNTYGSSSYGYGYSGQTTPYGTGSTQFTKDTTAEFSLPPVDDEDDFEVEDEEIDPDNI